MEQSFAGLNALVRGGSGNAAPLDAVLKKAEELGNYCRQNSAGQASKSAAARIGGGDVVEQANDQFKSLPEPMRSWLLSLSAACANATLSGAKGDLADKAKAAGIASSGASGGAGGSGSGASGSPCRAAFAGRYPFVRGSQQDAPLADFAKYFAPGGVFDQFFQANLKDFVDTAANPWRQKSSAGQSLGLSPDAIRQFQSAAKIRDAFFSSGPNLQVQFDLKLLDLSPAADNVHFYNEGQDSAFRGGQGQATRIQWPGPAAGTGVRITFETPDKQQAVLQKTGPWALFRLLEESSLQHSGGPERFTVSFQAQSFTARFELQASSVNNPFSLGEARNFHCPESL
jgi:type VI secretion system protein ImpL